MKYAHYVQLRIFCLENEDELLMRQKILDMFPFEPKKELFVIKSQKAELFENRTMRILTLEIKRPTHVNKFLELLFSWLGEPDRGLLLEQLSSRLDEDLNFFLRLDKEKFLKGEYAITETGNCLHIKIAIAAYPHKREIARTIVKRLIGSP
jgi:RNA binding exosome subunit